MDFGVDVNEELTRRGRPKKPFNELSIITKRQNAKKLREKFSIEELGFTLEKSLKAAGFVSASKLIKDIIESPDKGNKYIESPHQRKVINYNSDEALALYVDMKSTKRQYQLMYTGAKRRGALIYPSYGRILSAKKRCYPSSDVISITEIGFKIEMQALLDLTVHRLIDTLRIKFEHPSAIKQLCLISKYGFDGASSQSNYKQKFTDPKADDSSIFMSSVVPILLHAANDRQDVYWKNSKPSSTTLCRPLELQFKKETEELVLEVNEEINGQIEKLVPTIIRNECGTIEISHHLVCSMLDGKICNHLSGNASSLSCYICNANPTDMNQLDLVYRRPKNIEHYKYGLSTLHAWLRFLQCVLNISYNKSFKKWRVQTQKHKKARASRKLKIQKEFKKTNGLKIDHILQGKGTSNDGNTARRFFRDYKTSAKITGFNVELLKRFAVILQALASGRKINVGQFTSYTQETARLYVKLYPWYYMPATVHKILIHGSDVIDFAAVPIGQLSEEVLECRHKEVRRFRSQNTRKVSRIKTNEDLLHSLLISSDPVVTSYRKIENSKKMDLFEDAERLLITTDDGESSSNEE